MNETSSYDHAHQSPDNREPVSHDVNRNMIQPRHAQDGIIDGYYQERNAHLQKRMTEETLSMSTHSNLTNFLWSGDVDDSAYGSSASGFTQLSSSQDAGLQGLHGNTRTPRCGKWVHGKFPSWPVAQDNLRQNLQYPHSGSRAASWSDQTQDKKRSGETRVVFGGAPSSVVDQTEKTKLLASATSYIEETLSPASTRRVFDEATKRNEKQKAMTETPRKIFLQTNIFATNTIEGTDTVFHLPKKKDFSEMDNSHCSNQFSKTSPTTVDLLRSYHFRNNSALSRDDGSKKQFVPQQNCSLSTSAEKMSVNSSGGADNRLRPVCGDDSSEWSDTKVMDHIERFPTNQTSMLRKLSQEFYGSKSQYGCRVMKRGAGESGHKRFGSNDETFLTNSRDFETAKISPRHEDALVKQKTLIERPSEKVRCDTNLGQNDSQNLGMSFVRQSAAQMSMRKAFGIFDEFGSKMQYNQNPTLDTSTSSTVKDVCPETRKIKRCAKKNLLEKCLENSENSVSMHNLAHDRKTVTQTFLMKDDVRCSNDLPTQSIQMDRNRILTDNFLFSPKTSNNDLKHSKCSVEKINLREISHRLPAADSDSSPPPELPPRNYRKYDIDEIICSEELKIDHHEGSSAYDPPSLTVNDYADQLRRQARRLSHSQSSILISNHSRRTEQGSPPDGKIKNKVPVKHVMESDDSFNVTAQKDLINASVQFSHSPLSSDARNENKLKMRHEEIKSYISEQGNDESNLSIHERKILTHEKQSQEKRREKEEMSHKSNSSNNDIISGSHERERKSLSPEKTPQHHEIKVLNHNRNRSSQEMENEKEISNHNTKKLSSGRKDINSIDENNKKHRNTDSSEECKNVEGKKLMDSNDEIKFCQSKPKRKSSKNERKSKEEIYSDNKLIINSDCDQLKLKPLKARNPSDSHRKRKELERKCCDLNNTKKSTSFTSLKIGTEPVHNALSTGDLVNHEKNSSQESCLNKQSQINHVSNIIEETNLNQEINDSRCQQQPPLKLGETSRHSYVNGNVTKSGIEIVKLELKCKVEGSKCEKTNHKINSLKSKKSKKARSINTVSNEESTSDSKLVVETNSSFQPTDKISCNQKIKFNALYYLPQERNYDYCLSSKHFIQSSPFLETATHHLAELFIKSDDNDGKELDWFPVTCELLRMRQNGYTRTNSIKMNDEFNYENFHKEITEQNKIDLQNKIEKILETLHEDRKLLEEEIIHNDTIGKQVMLIAEQKLLAKEFEKYKLYIDELDKVLHLLLNLSKRLSNSKNAVSNCSPPDLCEKDKNTLISKLNDLSQKYEDARMLKMSIDHRGQQISGYLMKYLSQDERNDCDCFIQMKLMLFVEQQAMEDMITLGKCQLQLLQTTA